MKISKILTKAIATGATALLLITTVVGASTIKTPNMGSVAREYADMVSKASIFQSMQNVVIDGFTRQCVTEAALDKAIQNANLAASAITGITYLDDGNKVWTGVLYGTDKGPGSNYHYVRDTGLINTINGYLSNVSVGPVSMTFKKNLATNVSTNEYYDKLWLDITTPLYPSGMQKYLVNFGGSSVITASQMSKFFSDYAVFLASVKAFDKAAGCYDTTTPTTPTTPTIPTTPTTPTTPVRPGRPQQQRPQVIQDAVITVRYTKIKIGTKFVIMDGVTARDDGGRGTDITKKVTVKGSINTAKLGSYRITYSVTGANGRVVTKVATYQVVNDIYQGGRHYNKW